MMMKEKGIESICKEHANVANEQHLNMFELHREHPYQGLIPSFDDPDVIEL